MNPANRNSNSQVTNIGITSPLGKAKESAFPIKGSNRHRMVLYGYFHTEFIVAYSTGYVNTKIAAFPYASTKKAAQVMKKLELLPFI